MPRKGNPMVPARNARFLSHRGESRLSLGHLGMELIILAALIGALILISALFSAMETAFFSLKPAHLRRLKNKAQTRRLKAFRSMNASACWWTAN